MFTFPMGFEGGDNSGQSFFISRWRTNNTSSGSSSSTQVKLPLVSTGTYDFVVNWGDGNSSHITTWNQVDTTHTYSATGTYTIAITGTCTGWQFNNTGDRLKILSISSFGALNLGNTGAYFSGCNNLIISAIDALDLTGTSNLSSCFSSCFSLSDIPSIALWNVASVTNMSSMFLNTTFNGDISGWNTGNVTNMSSMFESAIVFNQNIGSWNTGNVTNMSSMFFGASVFNQNIGAWNTGNVTNMSSMFEVAFLFNQDIGGWNTGNVSNMSRMFAGANVFNQNIGGWNVTSLTNASTMFGGITLSNANYNALLIGWAAQTVHSGVTFSGGNSHYNGASAIAARATLTGTYLWTITDGGTP